MILKEVIRMESKSSMEDFLEAFELILKMIAVLIDKNPQIAKTATLGFIDGIEKVLKENEEDEDEA